MTAPEERQASSVEYARQMVEDMIATKRANREAVSDAWVKRLADLSAQQRGEKADDGAVYSLEVEGHPLYDGRPVLRNLVPIKVSSVADAQRKLDNALDLERKVATEFYGAQQAMRAAKTAAQKKAAQARLTALNNQGWDADSLKALRATTIGELSRLLDTATERFGAATPNAEAPVQAAPRGAEAGAVAPAPSELPRLPVEAYRVERRYANGAVIRPLPGKAFTDGEVQQIADASFRLYFHPCNVEPDLGCGDECCSRQFFNARRRLPPQARLFQPERDLSAAGICEGRCLWVPLGVE